MPLQFLIEEGKEGEMRPSGEELMPVLLNGFLTRSTEIKYLICGEEIGDQENQGSGSGYKHLQGFVNFQKRKSMKQVKDWFGWEQMHLEISKGTDEENKAYCSKDGKFIEVGIPGVQGKRTDLHAIAEIIENGGTVKDCWKEYPTTMIRCHKGVEELHRVSKNRKVEPKYRLDEFKVSWQDNAEQIDWTRSVILWGEAGIGKTSFARSILPNALLISHLDDLSLYEGGEYDGIIFDDMSFNHIPREGQIHLVDIDEYRSIHIRYKTAGIPENTKKIFTTNLYNGTCFDLQDAAIKRRTEVILLN